MTMTMQRPAPAATDRPGPDDAPRPGRCRATGVSRAGGGTGGARPGTPCLTTPCHADPAGWEVRPGPGAAATIEAAVRGCGTCWRTHRAVYDACAATPRGRRSPLTVMAGRVVSLTGLAVDPARFVKVFLPRLRNRDAA